MCPVCGVTEWLTPPRPHTLAESDNLSAGVPVFPFRSNNCGFVRLHAPNAVDVRNVAGLD